MATESRKESKLYLRSKESSPGVEDDYDFWKTESCILTKPRVEHLWESNAGKLGQGEMGDKADLLGVYAPLSIKATKLSEVALLMSYALGKTDAVSVISAGDTAYSHALAHHPVTELTLPTFGAQYVDGSETLAMNHCIINGFDLTLGVGGNGLIDFTADGFCNLHNVVLGVITRNTVANAWSAGTYDTQVAAESLINFAGCKLWQSTALESTPLAQSAITFTTHDLGGSPEELSAYLNSIHITYTNGLSAENMLRAGGGGVLNYQERAAPSMTLELVFDKDDTVPAATFDATSLAGTQKALELQWLGKNISGGYQYAMNLLFPKIQYQNVTEDDETPIHQTIPAFVYQDSSEEYFYAYVQSAVDLAYNDNH